jgi:hypothetical protein
MGKVILMDSEKQAFAEALQAVSDTTVEHMLVVTHRGEEEEEFFFFGHPAKIYQMLALAQAHIIQTHPLLEVCECETYGGEE